MVLQYRYLILLPVAQVLDGAAVVWPLHVYTLDNLVNNERVLLFDVDPTLAEFFISTLMH